MKRNIISFVLSAIILLSSVITVFAADLPADYCFYSIDGMQRVFATSSYSPEFRESIDTKLVFDHRTGTGIKFDFSGKETKKFSIYVGSLNREKVEKIAMLVEHDENTSVDVALYVTNDPEFKTWMGVDLSGDGKADEWNIISVGEMDTGFAFYRFDFEVIEGDSFELKELALFRTQEITEPQVEDKSNKPLFEREQWRKTNALLKYRKV